MTTNTKFNTVLNEQTKAFLSAVENDKKTEQAKMLAVYTTAQAMSKGSFTGILAEDGKKIGASHALYVFGQILAYCQKFVDAGRKDLLLVELKNDDGTFIGLRKAKEFLPALGRDSGLADKFPTRAVGNTSKPKADEKQNDNAKTLSLGDLNADVLSTLTLEELVALSAAVKNAILAKATEDDTAHIKPAARKPAARKAA